MRIVLDRILVMAGRHFAEAEPDGVERVVDAAVVSNVFQNGHGLAG